MYYIFSFLLILFVPWNILAKDGINYHNIKEKNHNYHILTIDPNFYDFKLVKSHNGVMGRETLDMIAKRKNAIAAINAGFFEIAGSEDGRPSGALIIDGKILGLSEGIRSLAILHENKFYLKKGIIQLSLDIGDKSYRPNQTNIISNDKNVILYSDLWGKTSLTPHNRKEVLISEDKKVYQVSNHGDNIIPKDGFILSFPTEYDLSHIKQGQKVRVNLTLDPKPSDISEQDIFNNLVMGIPIIVQGRKISEAILNSNSSSNIMEHARTAVGIKPNGEIIMLVVEHEAAYKLKNLSIEQARNILKKNGYKVSDIENMEMKKVIGILQKSISSKSKNVGLSLKELAEFMIKLGCIDVINFDGGGSSSMYYENKIVNNTIGDKDESLGQNVLRPISDAIIVVPKNTK